MLLYSCTLLKHSRQPAGVQLGWATNSTLFNDDVQGYMVSKAANDKSFKIIERSNFTLAPRGHGSSSWRMCGSLLS